MGPGLAATGALGGGPALLTSGSAASGAGTSLIPHPAPYVAVSDTRVYRGGVPQTSSAIRAFARLLPAEWKKPIAALFITGLALVPIIYSGNMTGVTVTME